MTHDPLYRRIADSLADRIQAGELGPDDRLPTHRELARELEVAIGTVTRAYAELEERGLVRGEVGRGTFVRGGSPPYRSFALGERDDVVNLGPSLPPPLDDPELATILSRIARDDPGSRWLEAVPHRGTKRHREAGAAWLRRHGLPTEAERIVVCAGAQHAIAATIAAIARPGDRIATERLTFSGLAPVAAAAGVRMVGIEIDEKGIVPAALERVCREEGPVALYTSPTVHNPTCVRASEGRRRRIAGILRAHDVALVEDDPYRPYVDDPPGPIAWHLPERSVFVGTWTKVIAPGLRIAFVHAPAEWVERLAAAVRATVFHVPPLVVEIATRWIEDGTVERIVAIRRNEAGARLELAERILGPWIGTGRGIGLHLWLELPAGVRAREIVARARERGVIALPGEVFAVDGRPPVEAIRVALGSARSRERLERGLGALREVLREAS